MISETFQTLALHISRANRAHEEVVSFSNTLSAESLDDFDKVKVIDSFIFRFIKIQDLMGNKLFRELLDALGEYQPSMSMLDVLDRLEKLELLSSAEQWMDYRNLRNVLTHEYPDNREELLEGIHTALNVFADIKSLNETLFQYAKKKGLLDP
ncbi:MAG: hypothetical protein L3J62_04715 [Gammaproteobacteria bacterium]|nr:hypothetical protein [Gammaproteobacteria bacterium]MCF6230087.1 hypothetical protein [Gammaproteobacteria bacterium]